MQRRLVVPALAVIVLTAASFAATSSSSGGDSASETPARASSLPPPGPVVVAVPVVVCAAPAPAVPVVNLDPALRVTGDVVRAAQESLGVPVDGVYGPVTAAAVASFQAPQDGCGVTPGQTATLAALTSLSGAVNDLVAQAVALRSAPRVSGPGPTRCGDDFACFKECTLGIESGGNYAAVSPGGTYRGAWQFDQPTWNSNAAASGHPELVGQDPASVSEAGQDAVALSTYQSRGNQPWGGRC